MSTRTRFEKEAKGNSEMVYYRLLPFCIDVIKCLPDASHHQTLSFPDSKQNEGTLMTLCDAYTKRAAVLDVALTYLYEKDRKCELRAIVIVSYCALNK